MSQTARKSVSDRRSLPSVSSLLERSDIAALGDGITRHDLVSAVRAAVAGVRAGERALPGPDGWSAIVADELAARIRSPLRPALNASGTVLHTNLGRAPLAQAAIAAMQNAAAGYVALEYDLATGDRGSRHQHCVSLLQELTGADDALVVNNCAAALVLALNTLAADREVVLSRGELIEIGGSFRIPDIMARSGARLVEVGATNRTHLLDYRAALAPNTAAIVKVHRSNFTQAGYVAEVSVHELATLASERSLPLVFDLGSGLLTPLEQYGFPSAPTARSAIVEGASLVLMSADKLLGGPQAGIAVGTAAIIQAMRSNPLARALRVDKLTIAALEATLRLHLDPDAAVRSIPTLAMLTAPVDRVHARAEAVAADLRSRGHAVRVEECSAAVGAGAFPAHLIPSAAVVLEGSATMLAALLRGGDPPVIGRLHEDRLLLDLRSVQEHEDQALIGSVHRSLSA